MQFALSVLLYVAGVSQWISTVDANHNLADISLEKFTTPGQVYVNGELRVTTEEELTPLSDADTYLDERATYYAEVVQKLASAYYAKDLYTTCTYYDQCRNYQGVSNESLVNFPDVGIAVNESITATKLLDDQNHLLDDFYTDDTTKLDINDVCYGNNKTQAWTSTLAADPYGGLAWQYLGFRDQGTFSIYPYAEKDDCQDGYDPRLRPWYVSAVTGPIDLWILIDVTKSDDTTAARVTSEVQTAIELLDTLSYWSFFNIGVYSSTSRLFSQRMLRASADNKNAANEFLKTINATDVEFSNLKGMFDLLGSSRSSSIASGDTSSCHEMVALLAGTKNSFQWRDPVSDVSNLDVHILTYVFNFDESVVIDSIYKDLACATAGRVAEIHDTTTEGALEVVESFTDYCAIVIDNSNVRYSEIYTDAFGLGDVITAAGPLYMNVEYDVTNEFNETYSAGLRNVVGVYGVDIRVEDINNGGLYSNDDIMAYLASSLVCPAFAVPEGALDYFRDGEQCFSKSEGKFGSGGQTETEKKKGEYQTTASVLFLVFLFLILGYYYWGSRKPKSNMPIGIERPLGCFTIVFFLAFGGGLLGYLLEVSWQDAVVHNDYQKTVATIIETRVDPYGCCEKTDCICTNYYGESCSDNKNNLIEGFCDSGYHCCEEYCYDCNCDDDGCDRCCTCTVEVTNQQCSTVCGTCYDLVTLAEYQPKEEPDLDIAVTKKGSCGMDNDGCADQFKNNNPVGKEIDLWYNPTDYTDVEYSNKLPKGYWDTVYALAIIWGLSILACIGYGAKRMAVDANGDPYEEATSNNSKEYRPTNSKPIEAQSSLEPEFAPSSSPSPPASGGGVQMQIMQPPVVSGYAQQPHQQPGYAPVQQGYVAQQPQVQQGYVVQPPAPGYTPVQQGYVVQPPPSGYAPVQQGGYVAQGYVTQPMPPQQQNF